MSPHPSDGSLPLPVTHRNVAPGVWMPKAPLEVRPEEFVSARDASRGFGRLVDRLEAGEIEKAVIVDRNRPRAILLSLAEYEVLVKRW